MISDAVDSPTTADVDSTMATSTEDKGAQSSSDESDSDGKCTNDGFQLLTHLT